METKFEIISYNKTLLKYGVRLFNIGFIILFVNAIPGVFEAIGMTVVTISIFIMILGIASVYYAESKTRKTGELCISESMITIKEENKDELNLAKSDFQFKIKDFRYKGQPNFIPFLRIGAFTTHSGINQIQIYNQNHDFLIDILIENKNRLDLILRFTE